MPMIDPAAAQQPLGQTPPQQEMPDQPAVSPTGEGMGGVVRASPEEQDEHDRFVARAMQLIYDDAMFDQVVQMLGGGAGQDEAGQAVEGNPVQGLASATESIVARVAQVADQEGIQVTPDVLYHAGADILEELAEVSRRARIKDYSEDPDALEAAWFGALDMFRERLAQVGELDQGSAQSDLDKLVQMDQSGALEKIMRELDENDRAGPAGGPEEPPERGRQGKPRGFASAMGV